MATRRRREREELLRLEPEAERPLPETRDEVAGESVDPQTLPPAAAAAGPARVREGLEATDPVTRSSLVLELQRTQGNAFVARQVLADFPAADLFVSPEEAAAEAALEAALQEPATEPHGGGAADDVLQLLAEGAADAEQFAADLASGAVEGVESALSGLADLFGFGGDDDRDKQPAKADEKAASPEKPAAPAEDPAVTAVKDWSGRALKTNKDYAQWILDADAQGFVHWTGKDSKSQMEKFAAGEKIEKADPNQAEILGGFSIIHDLLAAKAGKWVGDSTKPKQTVAIGSFIRTEGAKEFAHSTGRMIDINELDWTGKNGPAQVLEALHALTPGRYGIGMPFQGEFFPRDEWFETRAAKAKAEAKDGDPAPIDEPSLVKWTNTRYTATWDPEKKDDKGNPKPGWTTKKAGGGAFDQLKSEELKKGINELNAHGYTIYVFPDNDNHIHIQKT
jgi:hypothetical protein